MRIISGRLGGRQFDSPGTKATHPLSDKARGALFSVLGDIGGLTFLDPFAGTGAVSFEAASRGAASALAIEKDKAAQRTIEQNIRTLGLRREVKLIKATANAWLQTSEGQYDVVFCDPPYHDLQPNLLMRLAGRVKPGGLFILSWPAQEELPPFEGLELLKHNNYGDATLAFYRQIS